MAVIGVAVDGAEAVGKDNKCGGEEPVTKILVSRLLMVGLIKIPTSRRGLGEEGHA